MNIFCLHHWAPYHATEILYFNGSKKHIRMFEVCQACKSTRQADIYPDDIEDNNATDGLTEGAS